MPQYKSSDEDVADKKLNFNVINTFQCLHNTQTLTTTQMLTNAQLRCIVC